MVVVVPAVAAIDIPAEPHRHPAPTPSLLIRLMASFQFKKIELVKYLYAQHLDHSDDLVRSKQLSGARCNVNSFGARSANVSSARAQTDA